MCFIHEQEYLGQCWDYMFFTEPQKFIPMDGDANGNPVMVIEQNDGESIVDLLRDVYNVDIKHEDEFKEMLLNLFQKMHETGVIAPIGVVS
jgi:hypothetical protein